MTVIIRRNELEVHVRCLDLHSVRLLYFGVEYLVLCYNTLVLHYLRCPAPDQYHLPLCIVFNWFNPGGVALNFVQDSLIFVAEDRPVWGNSCLVCVHSILEFVQFYENIALLFL